MTRMREARARWAHSPRNELWAEGRTAGFWAALSVALFWGLFSQGCGDDGGATIMERTTADPIASAPGSDSSSGGELGGGVNEGPDGESGVMDVPDGEVDANESDEPHTTPDAGAELPDDDGNVDGGVEPGSGGEGTCGGDTPHGCYTLNADNPAGCPLPMPEIATNYPFDLSLWDGCSMRAVRAFASCNYTGPNGERGFCICDSGLHWICFYGQGGGGGGGDGLGGMGGQL